MPGSITATPLVGSSEAEELAAFSESMTALYRLGDDTQDIATALQKTMQTIVDLRPDLAEARFDFVSKNGSLEVLSTELSLKDKNWLAAQLNANTTLAESVQAFNDDATTVYNIAAGKSLTAIPDSAHKVSDPVDGAVKFLSLLNSLGSDIQSTMDESGGTYSRSDGGPLDLSKAPDSAVSFLSFVAQMQAVQDGALTFESGGKFYSHAMRMPNAYWDAGFKLSDLLPDSASASLGLSVTA
jgi:hypothetical protein